MNYLRLLPVIIPLIILYSCEFQSKEENFVEIETPVSKSTIDLESVSDSIYLYDLTDLNYSFVGNGHNLYSMKVYLDDVLLKGNYFTSGKITIDPLKYNNGLHSLKMVYETSTNSGSMADVYKAEAMLVEKNFKIVVDNIPPNKPILKSVYTENGNLLIEWEKLNKYNFRTLKVNAKYNGKVINSTLVKKDTTLFKDESYTGGEVEYEIEVVGYKYSLKSNTKSFDTIAIKDFHAEVIDPWHIKFSWDDPVFDNNISSIRIFGNPYNSYNYTISNIEKGTEVIDYNLAIGELLPVHVVFKSKTNIETEQYTTNLYLGQSSPKYISPQTFYDKGTNSYFSLSQSNSQITKDPNLNNLYIYKSDRETLGISAYQLIGEITNTNYFFSITTNGFGYIYSENEIIKFSLEDLSNVQRVPFEDFDGIGISYFKVTDNNLLFLGNELDCRLIDLSNNKIIHSADSHDDIAISNDGKFIYYNGTFFKIENNLVSKIIQVEDKGYEKVSVQFLPGQPGMCLVDNYLLNQLELYDLNNNTINVIYSSEEINEGKLYYDLYQPDYAIIKGLFNFTLVNYKTKQTQVLPITNEGSSEVFYYSGGRIFLVYGHKYDINFNHSTAN